MSERRLVRRILKSIAVFATLGVIAVGTLTGLLWFERRAELTLPAPTGSYAVGRAIYDWTDSATLDTLAPVPEAKRELLVWIWYPSVAGPSVALTADYVPAHMRPKGDYASAPLMFRLLTRDPAKVHGHSLRDSDLSPQQRSYPLLIMRAGASAPVVNYSTLAEDLASHGYVVVGFDAPYRTNVVVFPDGRAMTRRPENNPEAAFGAADSTRLINRVLSAWTGDITFVLDRLQRLNASDSSGKFKGRLDMARVGVFGHSFGGATAAQFCHDDSRCKAGVDLDGAPVGSVIRDGLHQPFMFVLSDQIHSNDPETRQVLADIRSIYDRLPSGGRLRIAIRGANHFTFSDDGALLKSPIVRGALRLFGKLGIDGRRQLAVTAYSVHSFFDAYLQDPSRSPPFRISSPLYPEIQVLQ
jgi:dienelactone hydrolase